MKISGLYEIYFSPTGQTQKVIDVFTKAWNMPKTKIDLTNMDVEFDKFDIYSEDLCVFAVPSFNGRVPIPATQRINQMRGNNTPAVIISTFGNRDYEDTLNELQDIVESRGFYVVAALAVPTQHSIVPEIGAGRIDEKDIAKLHAMSITVRDHLIIKDGFNKAKLKGNETYRELKVSDYKPTVTNKCVGCGVCAKNCPVGAIPLDDPKVTDNGSCISCMRCVVRCPKEARVIPKAKISQITAKLKKECTERKEIKIYINNNTGNEGPAVEAPSVVKPPVNKVEPVVKPPVMPPQMEKPPVEKVEPTVKPPVMEEKKEVEDIDDFGVFDDLVFDDKPENNIPKDNKNIEPNLVMNKTEEIKVEEPKLVDLKVEEHKEEFKQDEPKSEETGFKLGDLVDIMNDAAKDTNNKQDDVVDNTNNIEPKSNDVINSAEMELDFNLLDIEQETKTLVKDEDNDGKDDDLLSSEESELLLEFEEIKPNNDIKEEKRVEVEDVASAADSMFDF